jgi:hypothetical protein
MYRYNVMATGEIAAMPISCPTAKSFVKRVDWMYDSSAGAFQNTAELPTLPLALGVTTSRTGAGQTSQEYRTSGSWNPVALCRPLVACIYGR